MKKKEENKKKKKIEECNCTEDCTCGCKEGKECTCEGNCNEECHCNDNCKCGDECNCNEDIIEALKKQVEDTTNELLKSKAEFINYRKRLEDEKLRVFKYCNEDLILDLLPTVDNFERAIKLDDTNLEDELSKFLEGFKMIYCNLQNVMKKFGVIEIDGYNKPFNPTYHQAVLTEKVEGVEPGYVVEVLQKGYILKDKVIRPAMVKVSE